MLDTGFEIVKEEEKTYADVRPKRTAEKATIEDFMVGDDGVREA